MIERLIRSPIPFRLTSCCKMLQTFLEGVNLSGEDSVKLRNIRSHVFGMRHLRPTFLQQLSPLRSEDAAKLVVDFNGSFSR